ncbi:MAG: hypothetical protein PHQ40_15615 [Anaerolineaceae bacterium]|nr:hypothetical protein [Anaerolineaceae bacterium]
MHSKRILVVGSGSRNAALISAFTAAGADVVFSDPDKPLTRRTEITGMWIDEFKTLETLMDLIKKDMVAGYKNGEAHRLVVK